MGNEKIAGFNHSFVGLGNGKSGMNRRIERVKVFVKTIWIDGIQTWMIGLDVDQADMGMNSFSLGERAQGKEVECAVAAHEKLRYTVFGDVAFDGAEKGSIEIRRGIGVTEEEAGLGRHRNTLPFNSLSALNLL